MNKQTEHTGKIVRTKLGEGYTINSEKLVHGKVVVYLEDGRKVLCDPEKLKLVGFYD
jgi:hypothetical protein